MEHIFAPFSLRRSIMATASAAPSVGSVPAPSSSIKTSELSSATLKMFATFVMCDEKVERLC